METMKTKIERDGRQWSYTVTTPDGQVAVREGGFFKRESAAVQAKVAMRDLESYQPEAFDIAYCPKCGKGFETDREKGRSHADALRRLGQRWLKIIHRMWMDGKPYDAMLHNQNQLRHGFWVLQLKAI